MNDRGRRIALNPGALNPIQSMEQRELEQRPAEGPEDRYFTRSPP